MAWNPDQYEKFKAERTAPFEDLLKLVKVKPGLRVIDLGCGTGELTRRLADALPDSEVTGLDNSASMLARSGAYTRPGLRFERGDIAELEGTYDLIFSNAALQWLPDHPRLFPKLWRHLNPGGQLVVQMPANHDHPSHRLARELAESAEFAAYFPEGGRQSPVLPPEDYARMLFGLGGENLTVLLKVYPHVLADAEAMVEWVKGTLLTAYLEPLPPSAQERFLEGYRARLRELFPRKPVFYGFKRILFSASKPG
ncbi:MULTISPECIES: methyltransferase domain-containing protein [unclassified Meiothermus]|uniref:methyltransferase domain-containing protein n=1 Tax=unclassified Meiothermus TaxID=370471 RepID=UPI000D7D1A2C|nr:MULTISPECIES: methyltransferase domain-containing protein [unclassified Meiothermus]PZA06158.1 trans-aconitate methyltransferase [Meiothermus sp. Pnk-1]RYM36201.1 methyltransferase domain-containing protein [Meiothermus sp. PNK-Is4]